MSFLNTCRICLIENSDEGLISILDDNGRICKMLFLISGIKIVEMQNSIDSSRICDKCLANLHEAYEFRNLCISSDHEVRRVTIEEEERCWNKKLIVVQEDYQNEEEVLEELSESPIKDEPEHYSNQFTSYLEEEEVIEQEETEVDEDEEIEIRPRRSKPRKDSYQKSSKKDTVKRSPCPICGKLLSRGAMWMHKKTLHRDISEGLQCHLCPNVFDSYNALESHLTKNHDDEVEHTCDLCGRVFASRSKIKNHLKNFHMYYEKGTKVKMKIAKMEGTLPQYCCSICGKSFTNVHVMKRHEKIHQEFSPSDYIYCEICNNKFKEQRELVNHIKIRHEQNIRFPCPECPGRSFLKNSLLQQHIKVDHLGIKEFSCEHCGKEFGYRQKLRVHLRMHTGETPYECKYCHQKFKYNTDCRRHEWNHIGYKGNIECPHEDCDARFMRNSDLHSHLSRNHATTHKVITVQVKYD